MILFRCCFFLSIYIIPVFGKFVCLFVCLYIMVGAYSENFEILAVWYQKPGVKIRLARSNFVTVKPPSEFRFYGKKKKLEPAEKSKNKTKQAWKKNNQA